MMRSSTHTIARSLLCIAVFAITAFASAGCSTVKPWDRDMLSRQDMAFDADPLESARRNHIYNSKEATPPGGAGGGGGCGCN
jgi:hypothetical protein